jgi:hypothetical protein
VRRRRRGGGRAMLGAGGPRGLGRARHLRRRPRESGGEGAEQVKACGGGAALPPRRSSRRSSPSAGGPARGDRFGGSRLALVRGVFTSRQASRALRDAKEVNLAAIQPIILKVILGGTCAPKFPRPPTEASRLWTADRAARAWCTVTSSQRRRAEPAPSPARAALPPRRRRRDAAAARRDRPRSSAQAAGRAAPCAWVPQCIPLRLRAQLSLARHRRRPAGQPRRRRRPPGRRDATPRRSSPSPRSSAPRCSRAHASSGPRCWSRAPRSAAATQLPRRCASPSPRRSTRRAAWARRGARCSSTPRAASPGPTPALSSPCWTPATRARPRRSPPPT